MLWLRQYYKKQFTIKLINWQEYILEYFILNNKLHSCKIISNFDSH